MGISKELSDGRKKLRIICEVLELFVGIVLLAAAMFAVHFGFDHDQDWGLQRTALAGVGIFLLMLSAYTHYFIFLKDLPKKLSAKPIFKHIIRSIEKTKTTEAGLGYKKHTPSIQKNNSEPSHVGWWAIAGSGIAIIITLWFLTSGTIITWPANSNYFDRLANAFLKGSFSLLEHPPAELLALPNPYDWRAREGLKYIWDASLFEGKYFLYFGPVPGLVAMMVKWFGPVTIDDSYLLFFFYIGFVICSAMVFSWVRKSFFPRAPAWMDLFLILLCGLCVPVLWLTKNHKVYESSILGGQFFLMFGLYAVLRGLHSKNHLKAWFCLGGFMWGASVGCRMTNAPGIVLMSILIGIFLLNGDKQKFISKMFWLIFPLAIWALCLGVYNYARFGNVLETGHRLQLTGPAYSSNLEDIFSTKYLIPNLYNILFRPPKISSDEFPFVFAPYIKESMWPWFIRPPEKYYYSEPIIGLIFGVPVVWLFFTALARAAIQIINWLYGESISKPDQKNIPKYQTWGIICMGLIGSAFSILLFVAGTMRYLVDITPLLTVCLAFYVWREFDRLRNRPFLKHSFVWLFVFLSLVSIFLSILINLDNEWFISKNPDFYSAIINFL